MNVRTSLMYVYTHTHTADRDLMSRLTAQIISASVCWGALEPLWWAWAGVE